MFIKSKKAIFLAACLLFQSSSGLASQCSDLKTLDWMLGQWLADNVPILTLEQWHKVSDDTFEGSTKTRDVIKEELLSTESIRLVTMNNEVFYIAKVDENSMPIAFKLVECRQSYARFENPEHDFPKQIVYQLKKPRLMEVNVSAGDKGFSLSFIKYIRD